jgi:hypothetical protein
MSIFFGWVTNTSRDVRFVINLKSICDTILITVFPKKFIVLGINLYIILNSLVAEIIVM